ncbi:Hypothetical predicted protein [Mytilus galloprovincialis]|uniref:Uncharacterized protein n=1 Tax=Mytilus galloprovincialis TaxID=29158 RepID=A0A8B6F3I3_MYTGA|nr:Hypothetical predicted protein [Mytilus galloprovincialis]
MRDIYIQYQELEKLQSDDYGGKQRNYGIQYIEKTHTMRHEKRNNCSYCGKTHCIERREDCGAYAKHCNKSQKWNHFTVVCKSVYQDNDQFRNQRYTEQKQVKKINVNKIGDEARTVLVMMNDVEVKVEPDSEADVNVMDEYQYRAYKN